MKRTLLSTVALLAGLAMVQTTPSQAQNAGPKGDPGSPSQSAPRQGSQPQSSPTQGRENGQRPGSRDQTTGQGQREESPKGQTEQRQDKREQGQRQEQQRPSTQRDEGGQAQKAPGQTDRPQTQSQPGQGDRDRPKQQQGQQSPQPGQQPSQQQGQQTPRPGQEPSQQQGQQTPQPGQQPSQQQAGQPDGSVNLTAEQRTRIRTTVLAGNDVPRVDNVNFTIRVGTVVPTSVRIVGVPATLIEIYPQWRGHFYFVVRDEIVIVDREHRIVSVVPVGAGSAAQSEDRDGGRAVGVSMTTEEIRRIQIILRERGYTVEVDGVMGPQTRQAIIAFQRKEGIEATGQIDQRTSAALGMDRNQASDGNQDGQRPAQGPGKQPTTTGQDEGATPGRSEQGRENPSSRRENTPGMNNAPADKGTNNNAPADKGTNTPGRSPAAR